MRRADRPARKFLHEQYVARRNVRKRFFEDARELHAAHRLLLSAMSLCLDRFSDQPWRETVSEMDAKMLALLGQQTAVFLQGIDPCEVAISEGLYGQAAALTTQRMEIVATSSELWLGNIQQSRSPSVKLLPTVLQPLYYDLLELAQSSVSDNLKLLLDTEETNLIGTGLTPSYNKALALLLFRIELMLTLKAAEHVNEFLKLGYGTGFNDEEFELFTSAIDVGNTAADDLEEFLRS